REYEISLLMLRGLSSKATANILNISPATENTHRKNIYKKMKVNSHAELLANVLEGYSKIHTHVANNEGIKMT
ncbi:MAG: helix-turn-helix transcriptional regulator, partial [Emcibacteraceae bacterium]|nr:helix-turn-helix transcriptional regulator [Emcibacteraceae bacterium]